MFRNGVLQNLRGPRRKAGDRVPARFRFEAAASARLAMGPGRPRLLFRRAEWTASLRPAPIGAGLHLRIEPSFFFLFGPSSFSGYGEILSGASRGGVPSKTGLWAARRQRGVTADGTGSRVAAALSGVRRRCGSLGRRQAARSDALEKWMDEGRKMLIIHTMPCHTGYAKKRASRARSL